MTLAHPHRPNPPIPPTPEPRPEPDDQPESVARHIYANLRNDIVDLEELISASGLSEDDEKRLDKAVTLLKVGSKFLKKYLKEKGVKTKVLVRP